MSESLMDLPEFCGDEYLTLDMLDQLRELKNSPRWRPVFVTGTDTEVGKTYLSGFLAKALQAEVYGSASLPLDIKGNASLSKQTHPLADMGQVCSSNQLTQSNQFDLKSSKRDFSKVEQLVGYYKAAISGAEDLESSDAGYVKHLAGLSQDLKTMTPYHFVEPLSPHLAAERTGKRLSFARIINGFIAAYGASERLVFEGTGGLYCPFGITDETIVLNQTTEYGQHQDLKALYAWVKTQEQSRLAKMYRPLEHKATSHEELESTEGDHYLNIVKRTAAKVTPRQFTICDIMRFLHTTINLGVILVGNSGLGSINHITSTFNCLQQAGFKPQDIVIIMNNFKQGDPMHQSNLRTVQQMNPALGVFTVGHGQSADEVFVHQDFVLAMQRLLKPEFSSSK